MGLLAPLYFAGALAVALPILFHLIRRTPHSRQVFSSLMFLSQSPPRLTRRSRLTNILLLILRAAALIVLAAAFARPFLSRAADLESTRAGGRRVAILLDTSASMRRADLWQQAIRRAEQTVDGLTSNDEAALYFFDEHVRPAMTVTEWNELEPARRVTILKSRLAEAKPTWSATHLGDAIATVADALADAQNANNKNAPEYAARQVILISDMQQGAHAESLQNYQWPKGVLLEVHAVTVKQPTNAGLQLVRDAADEPTARDNTRLRVRVNNEANSTKEQFSLTWATAAGPIASLQPHSVYVPPGKGQVVKLPWPKPELNADRLVLTGDDADFDNTLYLVPPRRENVRVLYVGDDSFDDVKGLAYYLQTAWAETAQRKVELVQHKSAQAIADTDVLGVRTVVASGPLVPASSAALRRFAQSGGEVLYVLSDASAARSAADLLGLDQIPIEESPARDYALLGRVDTRHPLFAPFADARFGDFTKIHFWKHRRMKLPAAAAAAATLRPLAWFDDGDPYLIEQSIGKGRVLVATAGWNPADSQLALSTKFVPLMAGLLGRHDAGTIDAQYLVNESIALLSAESATAAAAPSNRALTGSDGKSIDLAKSAATFDHADQPGIYHLSENGRDTLLAVNVHPDESRTAPLTTEDLERWGAKVGKPESADEIAARDRRLKSAELENRQKLWRWLILGVLGLLAVETALAGRLARRTATAAAN
ncbi:MAG: N-terminal double-transrane protein [Phycisphaerales bacterium]|nr:N-terminal double-transrane protein [Phycisphaerales bacterium]